MISARTLFTAAAFSAIALIAAGPLQCQTPAGSPEVSAGHRSIVRAVTAPASGTGTFTEPEAVMIRNRARVFGDQATASGARYFHVADADVLPFGPKEVLNRLTPTLLDARTRSFEAIIDLQRPIRIETTTGQPAYIGAAIVSRSTPRSIEVRSSITAREVKVIAMR